jgi:hypothetical protein
MPNRKQQNLSDRRGPQELHKELLLTPAPPHNYRHGRQKLQSISDLAGDLVVATNLGRVH